VLYARAMWHGSTMYHVLYNDVSCAIHLRRLIAYTCMSDALACILHLACRTHLLVECLMSHIRGWCMHCHLSMVHSMPSVHGHPCSNVVCLSFCMAWVGGVWHGVASTQDDATKGLVLGVYKCDRVV